MMGLQSAIRLPRPLPQLGCAGRVAGPLFGGDGAVGLASDARSSWKGESDANTKFGTERS